MKCIIPSQNVKIVARAIHSLAKIGDELYIEPTNNDLIFCSVSSAQSALCEFKMCRSFFSSYNFTVEDSDIKCKVAMKSCLGVFKNPHCADKQVESCEIRFKSAGTVVIFYVKYTNTSTKKFFLPIIDSEKVEVNYEKDAPNRIVASSKLLASSFKNFRSNEDEITIIVTGEKVVIKNHLEPGRDKGLMRTELSFQPSEFDCCSINSPTSVTFTLREMRSAITFAEPANLPVNINIIKPGEPLVLKVAFHPAYESTYVIATLRASRMDLELSNHVTQASTVPSRQNDHPNPIVNNQSKANDSRSEPGHRLSKSNLEVQTEINTSVVTDNLNEIPENIGNVPASTSQMNCTSKHVNSFRAMESNSVVCERDQPMDVDDNVPNLNFELIYKVFKRCFIQNNIFYSYPGHDELICDNESD